MKFSASLIVLTMSAAPAFAQGVLITQKTTTGAKTTTNLVQLEPTRMRAEMSGEAGATKQAMMFDGTQQVMRMVDYDKKSYSEMTKADADRIGAQMQDAMGQLQTQMANMPPAQRAQMEAMMRGRLGGMMQPSKPEYRRAGTDKVGKWTCDKYEEFKDNVKVSEVCTVEPRALGLTPADLEVTKQMAQFFQKLMPQNLGKLFAIGDPTVQGFSGVPIRTISFNNGQVQSTNELVDISRQAFPASSYEAPPGFQKTEMFGGRGRGRGR